MYSDSELIEIVDKLNLLSTQYKEFSELSSPRLLAIGTQSSGKSSLLNNIIGFNILPTGHGMITQTPINIRMIRDNFEYPKIMLYTVNDFKKFNIFEIVLDQTNNVTNENTIKTKILEITNFITNNTKNISETIIYIDIYWNKYITNFSLVDLPGRILIADSNQPQSLKTDICNLIRSQLLIKNTIALVVIQAKTDLGTDLGLDLLKNIENEIGIKIQSVGVITKPDTLTNENNILNDFVAGRMDKSVSLTDGYFIVNNIAKNEDEYFYSTFDPLSDIIKLKRHGIFLVHHLSLLWTRKTLYRKKY